MTNNKIEQAINSLKPGSKWRYYVGSYGPLRKEVIACTSQGMILKGQMIDRTFGRIYQSFPEAEKSIHFIGNGVFMYYPDGVVYMSLSSGPPKHWTEKGSVYDANG